MDFLLHIFNFSWFLCSFPFIWNISSIISIHKMGNFSTLLLPSGLSLSPPACQSFFERIIPSRSLYFLESNSILTPRLAGFRLGRSTLDQTLYLSKFISDGCITPMPGSRTILSTIDFVKAFGFVWYSALFHKLISAGLLPCFARRTQFFLSDWCASVAY